MIFGFNTDVKYGGTVYHVQSEARKQDLLLQTQVFVKGQCIGKRATSYAEAVLKPGFEEAHMHEMLKDQHRLVLAAVREGKVNEIVGHDREIQDVGGAGLALRWVNSDSVYAESTVVMVFQVTDSGAPIEGAKLTVRLAIAGDAPIYSQASTDSTGHGEMKVFLDENALREAAVLVQASHAGKSATRKFRLKKAA
ncbi:MAG: hypothetical protein L0212_10485 [Acidobacteria bacterium]|nr:hypothetical protein [Acidobacteriota bacterium]